jgi:LytS/YehU family sensor histidine kinase
VQTENQPDGADIDSLPRFAPFFAMDIIFSKICVLVTTAFALTLVPGFRRSERSLLSLRDRGTALLVFMILGLVEQTVVGQTGWFNHRIVAVCAAGLLAGPGVGVTVAGFVTWLAVAWTGRPPGPVAISMLCGGLAGGWLYRWRPKLAQQPLIGFCLTAMASFLRDGLTFLWAPDALAANSSGAPLTFSQRARLKLRSYEAAILGVG